MINRFITNQLLEALKDRPVVFLNGARQVGKSTLVQWLSRHQVEAAYFTLDDINVLSAVQSDPVGFLSGINGPVILDEIQRAPQLFLSIKAAVDSNRLPGQFLLTGSSHVMTLPTLSQALVGRMAILPLFPLSTGEIIGNHFNFVDHAFSNDAYDLSDSTISLTDIVSMIRKGGFPEIAQLKSDIHRTAWFNDYLNTIIQRDVKDISNIIGLTDLPQLIRLLAAQSGQLLNVANLSRKTGVEQKTLKRYIILLESIFMIRRLPAWFSNIGKRLIKSPKIYFNDTGLLSHMLGVNTKNTPPETIGLMLENYLLLELLKMASWCSQNVDFYYYRTAGGVEVDIIMENSAGKIVAMEVKRSATLKPNAIRGIKDLQTVLGNKFHRGIIFYTGSIVIPLDKNIHAVPIGFLMSH